MSEIAFSLAEPADDAGIRHLLATQPMPGRIRIRFEREPAYFAGCATMGPFTQVLVAKDGARVVGVACRAVRPLYVNGVAENVGYLGQLRVDERYRGRLLVARGFRKLRELHGDQRARGYVTTIVEGNAEAEGVLVASARRGMPRYRFLETLHTLAIPVRRVARPSNQAPPLEAVHAFLETHGPSRNLFPADEPPHPAFGHLLPRWRGGEGTRDEGRSQHRRDETAREEFDRESPLPACGERVAPSLSLGTSSGRVSGESREWVTVERRGSLTAVAALDDQRSVKQSVIDGYDPLLAVARPLVNAAARLTGRPMLPPPGTTLRTAFATHFCVAGDDPALARELIERLLSLAAARDLDHLLLGFTSGDPLLAVARRFRPIEYRAAVYTVSWDDGDDLHDRLDARPRALDISAL